MKISVTKTIVMILLCTSVAQAGIKKKGRALDLVIYPSDSSKYIMIGNFIETMLKEVFVASKRFNVVNENKQNEQIFLLRKRLLQEGSCKNNKCFDKIKKLILTDVIIKIEIQEIDKTYVIEFFAIDKHNSYKIITTPKVLRYKKLGDLFDNIKKDAKRNALALEEEIWIKTHKPDWIIDLELNVAAAYIFNTGNLGSVLHNGWGGLVELQVFGLWQNMFVKVQACFFSFSGKNYSEEKANFITTDIGGGYLINIPHTRFAFSPSVGIGGVMSVYQSGEHADLTKRGILNEENTTDISKAPYACVGFKIAYQFNAIKTFIGLYDNIYFTKNITNQVVTSAGVLYMF